MEIIAYYLPQYHPTSNNNMWWGEGFTEWTNVAKARPLYHGHYQPKIPADLGFYDLRMSETRVKQATLAKEAGITGFCYYHYWFGNGHQELELPFNEVVRMGEPDIPFCLCWANESWYKKFWNMDGAVVDKKILANQQYLGEADDINHFNSLLKAFQDSRYIKINNKLAFVIYKPLEFCNFNRFKILWNRLAKENNLPEFYFIGFTFKPDTEGDKILSLGFDAIDSCRLNRNRIHNFNWLMRKAFSVIFHTPRKTEYRKFWPSLITELERNHEKYFPTIIPNWDHTPRSGVNGDLLSNSTPEEFEKHCIDVLQSVSKKNTPVVFIKSWNEWGEGNYMEPDLKFGKGYIRALRSAIDAINK